MAARTSRRVLLGASLATLAGCSSGGGTSSGPASTSPTPTSTPTPTPSQTSSPTPTPSDTASAVPDPQVVGELATGLAVPWGIAFLPDGTALVGERDTGRVLRVTGDGGEPEVWGRLDVRSRVDEGGETGLLGLAVVPRDGSWLYAYLSTDTDNRVVRMRVAQGALGRPEPVLTGIATSVHHNGGGLVLGPDGMLYVSTGDAEDPASAPDPGSLNGKVLRMTEDGDVPRDNPQRGSLVWTRGHRNVEGLAFDDRGRLWASEFGDKGADELNRLRPGRDYGWPRVEGDSGGRYTDPLAQWPVDACSPSGVAVAGGRAWLGALQGECVWSVELDGPRAGRARRHLEGYGRVRSVVRAPSGELWVTTSNRDGRTDPGPGDDRILRVRV